METKHHLYGITPVEQCLLHNSRNCTQLLLKEGMRSKRLDRLVRLAREKSIPLATVDAAKLAATSGTRQHQGVVLSCGELKGRDLDDIPSLAGDGRRLLVAMDQVEDPQNLGAVIRSAAFLGATGLITLRKNAAPLSPAVSKASAGALEHFPVFQVGNLSETLQRLRKEGYTIIGATGEEDAVPFREIPVTDWMVLVMGNEGEGLLNLTRKRCDFLAAIPGSGTVESLNVSAAAAILIQYLVTP